MALVLPYPSMVFVPLDVLTAEEMNQIVANYEFIANQFPLTSDKIDWSTAPSVAINKIDWSTITTITDSTVVFDSATYTIDSFKAYKIGRIFVLERLEFASHQSSSSGRIVARLKSDYIPSTTLRTSIQQGDNQSPRMGMIGQDGQLSEYAPNNITNTSIWYETMWICAS